MRIALIAGVITVLASLPGISLGQGSNGTEAPQERSAMFDDVPLGDWTYTALAKLSQNKAALPGYPNYYGSHKRVLTRYEFAVAVKRCSDATIPSSATPDSAIEFEMPGPPGIHAENIKLLRKLTLYFKPEIVALGVDWKSTDDKLLKLQDERLHADIAEALKGVTQKPADAANFFDDVGRPSWIYDAFQLLSLKKLVSPAREGRVFTRYEAAVAIKRCFDGFDSSESNLNGAEPHPFKPSIFELGDVIEIHKLVRAFFLDLPRLGMDVKVAEVKLSKAEERLINADEVIDLKPQVVK